MRCDFTTYNNINLRAYEDATLETWLKQHDSFFIRDQVSNNKLMLKYYRFKEYVDGILTEPCVILKLQKEHDWNVISK